MGTSCPLSTRGSSFCSGTAPTPVSLSNRFTVLDESAADVHVMTDGSVGSTESDTISLAGEPWIRRRRLNLVWDNTHENPEAREEGESEGSSAGSVVGEMPEVDEVVEEPVLFSPVNLDVRARNVAMGMASLDGVNLAEIFKQRARVMRSVPLFLKGAFRSAMRVALEEAQCARDRNDSNRDTRAWKLFLLLPRMLLSRPLRAGRIPRMQLEERFQKFSAGQWAELIEASTSLSTRGSEAAVRRRRRDQRRQCFQASGPSVGVGPDGRVVRTALSYGRFRSHQEMTPRTRR